LRALLNEAFTRLSRGDAVSAARAAQSAVSLHSGSAEAHYLLGNAQFLQGRTDDAALSYRQAIAIAPDLAEAHNNLGTILEGQGSIEVAAQHYRDAIAIRAGYAEAHNNLGNALGTLGRGEESVASFRAALAARPGYTEARYNLANGLAKYERGEEAVAAFRKALALRPRFPEALNNLAPLLVKLGRPAEAERVSRQAISLDPRIPEGHYNLGEALRDCGRPQEAIAAFRSAIALRPSDADSHIAIGNILQSQGRIEEAQASFRHAQRIRPLTKWPAAKAKADFSVLLISSPGAANTPIDYLVGRVGYDSYILALMPGVEYDAAPLRAHADVVVNLISDADRGGEILPLAADLVDRLGRPVINHPRKIPATGRDAIASRLSGIPRCRVPMTVRISAGALTGRDAAGPVASMLLPLLIRPTGVHGGEAFELAADWGAVVGFVSRHPSADYYLTEYVEFRSPDGHYRKYRLIFVDGQILPYHLAIADRWKVHHFRTDMANQAWMRAEEEAFVRDPTTVFDSGHMAVFKAIQAAIGLDYFGIDCALNRDGDIVVFEVNATMLVHGESAIFAYKQPAIARIKGAFDAMLARSAGFVSPMSVEPAT